MKLYYSPGACSLASHITLNEAGAAFTTVKVNVREKVTESGADFRAISPRGAVPVLELDGGEVLTEGVAIMQHVMDSAAPGVLPAGTLNVYYEAAVAGAIVVSIWVVISAELIDWANES